VDELRSALELASEDELRDLTDILFRPKFNPLDYLVAPDPLDLSSLDRTEWLDQLEHRFRYLAADGVTVLQRQTHRMSYRQTLLQVCRHLKLAYEGSIATTDLEAEIFLHLLSQAWKKLPADQQRSLLRRVERSLFHTHLWAKLPLSLQQDPMSLMVKGGSAITLSAVIKPLVLQLMARQFSLHFARYQVARSALTSGGLAATVQVSHQVTSRMAQRGMTIAAARYGATQTAFSFLGPMLWTWFLADLGWRSISTNYGRIIPTVFSIAQIRLTRSVEVSEILESADGVEAYSY